MFYPLFLTFIVWLTYFWVIKCGFVSDDIEGLQNYDGKLKKFDYGHLSKWLLYKLLEKSPARNHAASIVLHNVNVILLYLFLITFIPQKLAFYTALFFAVHPICTQSIAWISGRGYPISLFFCLLGLNISTMINFEGIVYTNPIQLLLLAGYGILYYFSILAQFAALTSFAIQGFFGNYFLVIIGIIISGVTGFGIIKEVVKLRIDVFKQQNLGASTTFKLSKIIVAIKSLGYYTRLCIFPKRMGLYHTFEYHYSEKTEKEDNRFWFGFFVLLGLLAGFIFGDPIVKFAILWYITYLFIFLNWITIHQFVSERYLYIPSIGICLLLAYAFSAVDNLFFGGYPVVMALVTGLYLMRTWVHLPTYQDEVLFYQSNIWNFPDSEVAFANLGVVFTKCNLVGSAVDMWMISTKINPDYDVGYYNISSVMKQRGDLGKAREFLEKAVNAKRCHFKELWSKELADLDHEINYVNERNALNQKLTEVGKDPAKKAHVEGIFKQLTELDNIHKKFDENKQKNMSLLLQEDKQLKERLVQLDSIKNSILKPLDLKETVNARDKNFQLIKEGVNKLMEITS